MEETILNSKVLSITGASQEAILRTFCFMEKILLFKKTPLTVILEDMGQRILKQSIAKACRVLSIPDEGRRWAALRPLNEHEQAELFLEIMRINWQPVFETALTNALEREWNSAKGRLWTEKSSKDSSIPAMDSSESPVPPNSRD